MAAGYDPLSRLFYWPAKGLEVSEISSHPSAGDVAEALSVINEAIGEFPYDSTASKANAIGALLTPIVRPAINGPVPLALLDAPQQGTGKSLLSSVIAITATGRHSAMMAAPDNDEEWRKRITATLYSGASVITVDNIEGQLKAASLANVLTAEVWKDRVLGRSESIELPQLATWLATGNNIRLGGDLQRRSYWIRLDANSGTPWLGRTFKHADLKGWVMGNRGRIIGALLTLTRAWFAAGKPNPTTPILGTFEGWSRTIGGILVHAGVDGFLGNLGSLYKLADEEAAEWETFLLAVDACFSGRDFTTARLVKELGEDPDLEACLPEELAEAWTKRKSGVSPARRMGKAFSRLQDRRYGKSEVRVVQRGQAGNAQKWRIVKSSETARLDNVVMMPTTTEAPYQISFKEG
jgi:hypothetical protein